MKASSQVGAGKPDLGGTGISASAGFIQHAGSPILAARFWGRPRILNIFRASGGHHGSRSNLSDQQPKLQRGRSNTSRLKQPCNTCNRSVQDIGSPPFKNMIRVGQFNFRHRQTGATRGLTTAASTRASGGWETITSNSRAPSDSPLMPQRRSRRVTIQMWIDIRRHVSPGPSVIPSWRTIMKNTRCGFAAIILACSLAIQACDGPCLEHAEPAWGRQWGIAGEVKLWFTQQLTWRFSSIQGWNAEGRPSIRNDTHTMPTPAGVHLCAFRPTAGDVQGCLAHTPRSNAPNAGDLCLRSSLRNIEEVDSDRLQHSFATDTRRSFWRVSAAGWGVGVRALIAGPLNMRPDLSKHCLSTTRWSSRFPPLVSCRRRPGGSNATNRSGFSASLALRGYILESS